MNYPLITFYLYFLSLHSRSDKRLYQCMNELQSAANKELTTKGTLSEVLKLVRSFVLSVVILSKAFDLLKYTSLTPKKTLSEILQLVKKNYYGFQWFTKTTNHCVLTVCR